MRLLITIICFCCALSLYAQKPNPAGLWGGRFSSNNFFTQLYPYKYELLLFAKGDSISGYSYSTSTQDNYYAVCEVKGKVFNDYMVVKETKTIYQEPPQANEGVLQTHILFFNGADEAAGDWKQNNKPKGQLMPGEEGKTSMKKTEDPKTSGLLKILREKKVIETEPLPKAEQKKPDTVIVKPKPTPSERVPAVNTDSVKLASREKAILRTIEVKKDSAILELYDDSIVDGDSVTVFANNTLLLNKVLLDSKPVKLKIAIPKNEELIISMYAENQGRIPPNTGLLIIRDGELRYEIRFSSDTRKSAAVRLKRK